MSYIDFHELRYALRDRREQLIRIGGTLLLLILIVGGAWWWMSARWKPPPSIFDTPVDDVLAYLAMDDFNELSLEERMKFLMDLSNRFRGMESSDSAAMAGFFAGVSGPLRQQMTQNVRILARDILVQGASGYFDLPPGDQGKYIDTWVVTWEKMGEKLVGGKERERTDSERLEGIRRQSDRNEERLKDRNLGPASQDGALGFMSIWQKEVEVTANPKQQGQIARFLDDVRKRYSDAF
ncbi:MAG: hypothetical protein EXS01_03250 [Phycisphaerales bacterium]|nr:hypothetical protein [Phycisphaerales bacterium]